MNRTLTPLALAALLLAGGTPRLAAQQSAAGSTTISSERARSIALARVKDHQEVRSEKLKTKDGVLVYEFDIETPGPGHQEVRVDAHSGAVLFSTHEDDLAGKVWNGAEKAADRAGAAASKAGGKVQDAAKDAAHAVSHEADKVFSDEDAAKINPPISRVRATEIAQGRVRGAPLKDIDLETENGVLVWEVDLDTAGPGHEEVLVDATTGTVLRVDHEN